jgi:hypothetical protein
MRNIALVLLLSITLFTNAQDSISNYQNHTKKNIIRWNITPMLFNTNNFTLGYERIIRKNQSMSLNLGVLLFPQFLGNESTKYSFVKAGSRFGFTSSLDYRFYLGKRNTRPAPDGLYIGPYFSYYGYRFNSTIRLLDNEVYTSDVNIDVAFSMSSLGVELGYQFIFWDRFCLDLILIGPSLSYYNGKARLDVDLEIDKESDAYKYLQEQILAKYPWLETFIDLDAINTGGKFNSLGVGFRYVIQIGFHF